MGANDHAADRMASAPGLEQDSLDQYDEVQRQPFMRNLYLYFRLKGRLMKSSSKSGSESGIQHFDHCLWIFRASVAW